jgi:hypothetical protein
VCVCVFLLIYPPATLHYITLHSTLHHTTPQGKFEAALAVAQTQVDDGAQVMDVNMDDALIDGKKAMVRYGVWW